MIYIVSMVIMYFELRNQETLAKVREKFQILDHHNASEFYAPITPSRNHPSRKSHVVPWSHLLRKAASYEQRNTNLGNQHFRRRIITYSATYYAALTRVSSYRHVGDTTVDFTWQNCEHFEISLHFPEGVT